MSAEAHLLDALIDAAFAAQVNLERLRQHREESLKLLRRLVAAYAGENTLDRKAALMGQVAVDAMAFLFEVDR
jgi:hypothetical protein